MNTTTTFATDAATIVADYQSADTATKARMRADMTVAIQDAVKSGDLARAGVLVEAQSGMKAAPKESATVDYAARLADYAATLEVALNMVRTGNVVMPEGVDVPDLDSVDWSAGVADTKLAEKLAVVTGRKAHRGAVVAWIESVVTDEPAKISDLRARWVPTSDYPKAAPSAGAIGAAFDRVENGAEGDFTVTEVDGKRGAVAI